jgi:hypothetical protein
MELMAPSASRNGDAIKALLASAVIKTAGPLECLQSCGLSPSRGSVALVNLLPEAKMTIGREGKMVAAKGTRLRRKAGDSGAGGTAK